MTESVPNLTFIFRSIFSFARRTFCRLFVLQQQSGFSWIIYSILSSKIVVSIAMLDKLLDDPIRYATDTRAYSRLYHRVDVLLDGNVCQLI